MTERAKAFIIVQRDATNGYKAVCANQGLSFNDMNTRRRAVIVNYPAKNR